MFKWRSRTLDIKTHCTYKYSDLLCRLCERDVEDLSHVLNCSQIDRIEAPDVMEISECVSGASLLKQCILRINSFLEKVNGGDLN